jgi:hypothetical protein
MQRLDDQHSQLTERLHAGLSRRELLQISGELRAVGAQISHLRNACSRLYNSL